MKREQREQREQREAYGSLCGEGFFQLCSFCQYADFSGCFCCADGYIECKHPLADRLEEQWGSYLQGIEPGDDCWGFRPAHPISLVADIVGVVLAQGWFGGATWRQDEQGNWLVAGVKI